RPRSDALPARRQTCRPVSRRPRPQCSRAWWRAGERRPPGPCSARRPLRGRRTSPAALRQAARRSVQGPFRAGYALRTGRLLHPLCYDSTMSKGLWDVRCPCCEAILKIDPETRAVISHKVPEKPKPIEDLAAEVAKLKGAASRRDEAFQKSF